MIEKVGYIFYNLVMPSITDLIAKLNSLPDGYISIKTIHGKKYFYLQQKVGNKVISKYLKNDEVEDIKKKLNERKRIKEEIKEIISKTKVISDPSTNSLNMTGSIYMEDTLVATFENDVLTYIDKKRCPLILLRLPYLSTFLKSRVIDTSRTNARILKQAMNIHVDDDSKIALYAHAASITDNYWFKPKGSKLKYKDVTFESDIYSNVSLKGDVSSISKVRYLSPELTLIGSYEKCWKKINDEWWMYKSGTKEEIYSELFCYRLALKLKLKTAKYYYEDGYIKTPNFATKYNFEPISSLCGDDDSYINVYNSLKKLGDSFIKDYLLLRWFDALVNNIDRHNENIGLLRDKKSGKIISLAPNFDNNLALISRNKNLSINPKDDGFISFFAKFIKSSDEIYQIFKSINLPLLNEKMIDDCLANMPFIEDNESIKSYILKRYQYLCNL